MKVFVAAATELEGALLRDVSQGRWRVLVTGVGQVNMAHGLTVAIEQDRPDAIVVVGIGGAYPESGLMVGDVVSAASEIYGDLGVEADDEFLRLTEFVQHRFELELFPTPRTARFVTVSACSGTDESSLRMHLRTRGDVENMEGAAAAQIAARYGVPLGEVRGISNWTGRRNRESWKIREAAEAAQRALLDWLNRNAT